MTSLRNSLPLSLTITVGTPKRHIQRSKNALATVGASLLRRGTSSVYFVKASVMTRMSLLPEADLVRRGPKRSMCTRSFGSPAVGKLCRGAFCGAESCASWHLVHSLTKRSTSAVTPGHQKLVCTLARVLSTPVWPATHELWAACRIFWRMLAGASRTCRVRCLLRLRVCLRRGGLLAALLAWCLTRRRGCLLYTSPSPRDLSTSRMPSSA